MKISAFISSPRVGRNSKTELMLNHLVEGMLEAGAEVDVINLNEKKIKNCIGCFTCWTKTPGKCIQKDDMTKELLEKWLESDMVVYATPLYHYGINATLKNFIERTLPSLEPFFEFHGERMIHPLRKKCPAIVMLSVSGMPDVDHFNAVSNHINYLCGSPGRELAAEIYRPAAESLTNPILEDKANDILSATKKAGRDLVRDKKVSAETMERITQPLVEPEFFAKMTNLYWKTCIAERVTPKEFSEKNIMIRPDSIESFMLLFPFGLNSEAVGEKKTVLQFKFRGELEDSCFFIIERENIESKNGEDDNPDIVIETPFELWMDVMCGKADGQQMFMQQKYEIKGDISLMIRLFANRGEK
ncbi:NAD(P)H-dependent oxidoreductase [Thermodesulfobacteriota bacterium]